MNNRVVFHIDADAFYASCEIMMNPELRGKPVVVCGSTEERHGICLAASMEAKKFGVKTGDVNFIVLQKCPRAIIVKPDYALYMRVSRDMRRIFMDYTPLIESFGLDEVWCDMTHSMGLFGGDAEKLARTIRRRIRFELGITVSIGISYNKIFAKLASDMRKPDGQTLITPENYREVAWPLPAADLLGVGPATKEKLRRRGIETIGGIAACDPDNLKRWLGKWGLDLWTFANGLDRSPVREIGYRFAIKSVGNSTTTPRDLLTEVDIKITTFVLAESVAARLRRYHLKCRGVQISMRFSDLFRFERQTVLDFPCYTSESIGAAAYDLFLRNWNGQPLRSLGVRGIRLAPDELEQMCLLPEYSREKKQESLEKVLDQLHSRFGWTAVRRGMMYADQELSALNPVEDHTIHPVSFYH